MKTIFTFLMMIVLSGYSIVQAQDKKPILQRTLIFP